MKSSKKLKTPPLSRGNSPLKKLLMIIGTAAIAASAFWISENASDFRLSMNQYIDNGEIKTLEVRFTPEKIMELYGEELLSEGERSFQKAELRFHPHALLNVKFSSHDKKTREGILLWSLVDGEMVINCDNWETSHGFEDAINAQATRNDFKILNILEKNRGKLSIEQLEKELHVDGDLLLVWIEKAKAKHLIVQKENEIQLHFQNPRFHLSPQTKITQSMVSKPYSSAQKLSWKYSPTQLKKTAQAAFGQDFAIRSEEIIFLPVYSIDILNPDHSIRTVDFNAVTGTPIKPHYLNRP